MCTDFKKLEGKLITATLFSHIHSLQSRPPYLLIACLSKGH